MKPDQLPECQIEENDRHFICYVMTYNDEENMYVDERMKFLHWDATTDENIYVLERIETCKFCGEQDVSYPI